MPNQDTLTSLMEAASYADYAATMHFNSHQKRGEAPRDCVACLEHEQELRRAEAALSAFQDALEAAA